MSVGGERTTVCISISPPAHCVYARAHKRNKSSSEGKEKTKQRDRPQFEKASDRRHCRHVGENREDRRIDTSLDGSQRTDALTLNESLCT